MSLYVFLSLSLKSRGQSFPLHLGGSPCCFVQMQSTGLFFHIPNTPIDPNTIPIQSEQPAIVTFFIAYTSLKYIFLFALHRISPKDIFSVNRKIFSSKCLNFNIVVPRLLHLGKPGIVSLANSSVQLWLKPTVVEKTVELHHMHRMF